MKNTDLSHIDLFLQNGDVSAADAFYSLQKALGPRGQGNIVLAQINLTAGDIENNAKKIMRYIKCAESINADMIVFPELALMGAELHDVLWRYPDIAEQNKNWLSAIAKRTSKTTVVLGFANTDKNHSSSLAILHEGKIIEIEKKTLFKIHGKTYAVSICDDVWNDECAVEFTGEKPDVLIQCSSSPSCTGKEYLKHNALSFISKKHKIPVVYVNQTGATDDYSCDGASRVYDAAGTLIARAKSFEEQFFAVNPFTGAGKIYDLPKGLEKTVAVQKTFSLDYEFDLERTYETIIQGIKDFFRKNGQKRAILGLSGGLDSAVCAVLLADALGKENVLGVMMPSEFTTQDSISDADLLAQNLGIHFSQIPIKNVVGLISCELTAFCKGVENFWHDRFEKSYTLDNIQARSRAMYLWGISNEYPQTLPIATSDKSELYMGYATVNGDMSGGFAPIADVTKTKLFALARWMNRNRASKNAIPSSILDKRPGAELAINPVTGKTLLAEEALMPYEFLDEIIWRIENRHESYAYMLDSVFLYESSHSVTKEQKVLWLDKFYDRMSKALYKWAVLPPSVLVESHSINKAGYKQPVTSCSINYKGLTQAEISNRLDECAKNSTITVPGVF